MEIELCGYKVQIDEEDYEKVTNLCWYVNKENIARKGTVYLYHSFRMGKKKYHIGLHRFLFSMYRFDKRVVDHINGDTLDNRKANLRICTVAENNRNQRMSKRNTSGYKGVSFDKARNKFHASIRLNKVTINLGRHNTAEEAYAAYCEASKKYHGEFGRVK